MCTVFNGDTDIWRYDIQIPKKYGVDVVIGDTRTNYLNKAIEAERDILKKEFNIHNFEIETIKLERIFVDKVFDAEFYCSRKMYFDAVKHIYDLIVMYTKPEIQSMLNDENYSYTMTKYKRKEESIRKGGIYEKLMIKEFSYLHSILKDKQFLEDYEKMQNIYIFNDKDRIALDSAQALFNKLKNISC